MTVIAPWSPPSPTITFTIIHYTLEELIALAIVGFLVELFLYSITVHRRLVTRPPGFPSADLGELGIISQGVRYITDPSLTSTKKKKKKALKAFKNFILNGGIDLPFNVSYVIMISWLR